MSVLPEISSAVLAIFSSKFMPICNRSHARRVNSREITISNGVPLLVAFVQGVTFYLALRNCATKKLQTLCYHLVITRSLYLTRT